MLSIEWENSYCSGILFLDTQNKHFVETLNLLFEYQDTKPTNASLFHRFQEVKDYARENFRQEEAFIEQFDPEGLAEHQLQHFLFLENFKCFCYDVRDGTPGAAEELSYFIRDWIVFHIAYVDKTLAERIKNMIHI